MSYFTSQKNHLTMSAIIIIFMSSLISIAFSGDTYTGESQCFKVDWKVAYKRPFTFGEDVILNCQTTVDTDLCTQCRKVWMGGPESNVLSLDGLPKQNSSKYWPTIRKDGSFEIIIRNFNRKDLNQYYTCSIGKNSCDRNLTIDMFEMLDDDASRDDANSSFNNRDKMVWATIAIGIAVFITVVISIIFIRFSGTHHKIMKHLCFWKRKLSAQNNSPEFQRSIKSDKSQQNSFDEKKQSFIKPDANILDDNIEGEIEKPILNKQVQCDNKSPRGSTDIC